MHITSLAPELSATSRWLCIWIIAGASSFGRAGEDLDHAPVLGLGHRRALGHAHEVAGVAGVLRVVGVQLCRAADVLAVQLVLDLALDEHRHRLVHLVADHAAFDRVQLLAIVLGHLGHPYFFAPRTVFARAISRRTRRTSWVLASWPVACCMRSENCSLRSSTRWAWSSSADFCRICLVSISAPSGSRKWWSPRAWRRPGGTPRARSPRRRPRSRRSCGRAAPGPPSTPRCPCPSPCGPRWASW